MLLSAKPWDKDLAMPKGTRICYLTSWSLHSGRVKRLSWGFSAHAKTAK